MTWLVEIDIGTTWQVICRCASYPEAIKTAAYFRPMQGFSGRTIRTRPES